MDSNDWQRIEEVFLEAAARAGAERESFLDEACGDDGALRAEVEAMLATEDTDELLWIRRQDRTGEPPAEPAGLAAGHRIGPYAVVRHLGSGGMGRVYLAERVDDEYRQLVALKVLRSDLSVPELEARFRAERQILAQLQHPNVSTLLDGGRTDDGRPYLVMQYEEGPPITDYADEHGLSIRRRLELFATVCDAVQFAHGRLVVHRDLKPSNIVVGEDGRPKLLDFGIAKILGGGLEGVGVLTTDVRLLTPEHAAPEQLMGEPVSTATDVYALGVLLCELLTGRRPFRADDGPPLELHRKIVEEPPTRPSQLARTDPGVGAAARRTHPAVLRGTVPAALPRLLSGDLDQIVLKALRKEPDRRYVSAGALADDVRAHLAGLPVAAQPDSAGYRVRKFVGRHRAGVTAAAALVVLLSGFAATMAVQRAEIARQRDEATRQRDRAERELANTQAVTEFVAGLFNASRPGEALGRDPTASELLARGAERVEALSNRPQMYSGMLAVLGRIYSSLGDLDRAEPYLERALAVRQEDGETSGMALGSSLNDLATLRLDEGRYAEAESLAVAALEVRRAALPEGDPAIFSTLNVLGRVQRELGDYESAASTYGEILGILRAELPEGDLRLVTPLLDYGRVLDVTADYGTAAELVREAVEIEDAAYPDGHPDLAITLTRYGTSLHRLEQFDSSLAVLERAVAMRRRYLPPDHPGIATSLTAAAVTLTSMDRSDDAVVSLQTALGIYERALGPDHPSVATTSYNLARALASAERSAEAEAAYRRALAIRRGLLDPTHPSVALVELFLGRLLMGEERYLEAETLLLRSADSYAAAFDEGNLFVSESRESLVELYEAWGRPEEADDWRD